MDYSYQPSPSVYNSSPIYYRPTPTSLVEQRFASSLDRSITNFRRFFSMEFSLMMRRPQPTTSIDIDFDEYAENLSNEISQIIEAPMQNLDINSSSLSRKIASAIDDQTKPLTTVLSESSARHNSFAETRLAELKQLQEELDSLRNIFKSNAEGVVRELERERASTASLRSAQIARQSDMEQRMRAVKLRQVELEARAAHQNVERDGIERQMKALESRKREFEENDDSFDAPIKIRQKILTEVANLRREIGQESFDEVAKCVEDALNLVRNESDNMRNELVDIEMANRWVATQLQMNSPPPINVTNFAPNQTLSPRKLTYNKPPGIPNPMNMTQMKLNQWRKQREEAVREVKDELS